MSDETLREAAQALVDDWVGDDDADEDQFCWACGMRRDLPHDATCTFAALRAVLSAPAPTVDAAALDAGLDDDDCTHRDERGSTVMQATEKRYECIVCGQRFRLVPAALVDTAEGDPDEQAH